MSPTTQSADKVLAVLDVLLGHFAHGLTPGDLVKATGLSASNITRAVATLEAAGFAERIPETGRLRPSTRLARAAVAILNSLEAAKTRLDEINTRITTPL
jgi:DNA-binding IclR family transcriptional regulator